MSTPRNFKLTHYPFSSDSDQYPEGNRPAKPQGLVHCAVSSLSRPPTSPLFSSFFGRETDETFISHTFFNFLVLLVSITYRPESLNPARLNAIRRNGDYSCAYPTQPPRPIRLPRPPRHRRARHPLHCRRRTPLHLRSRPIRRPSHLPHPLPRLPSLGLRPMLLPLRHHPHHPRLQRHPPSPRSPGRQRSPTLPHRRPLPRRLPRPLPHARKNPPRPRQPRRPVRRNHPRGLDRNLPRRRPLRNLLLHPPTPRPRTAQPPDIRFTPRDPPLHPQPRRPKFP